MKRSQMPARHVNSLKDRGLTLLISAAGTAFFYALSLPLPFLFGPLAACLLAALAGLPLKGLGSLSVAARTIIGVAVGASITPEVVERLPDMVASVSLIPIYIALIAAVGVPFFHKVYGFNLATSWYAAMPGGLQDMVIFGQEAGGDPRALSLIHATRVLIIITIVPLILTKGFDISLNNPIGDPVVGMPWHELLLMVAAALIGWKAGERIGLFGASILGPMILAAILSLTDLIHFRPPSEAILGAQFMIGLAIGVGYVGVTLAEIKRDVAAGVLFVALLAILAAIFTEIVVALGFAKPLEGFLAFAPGGQAEMTILAIVVGADLGFVIVHHLVRVIFVITCAPLAARFLRIRPDDK